MTAVCDGEVWDSHDHFFTACFVNQVLGMWRLRLLLSLSFLFTDPSELVLCTLA